MTTILYFDCFAGISGDMILGALLDLGVDREELFKQLNSLKIDGYKLAVNRKQVKGIIGTDFDVVLEQEQTTHRHLADIEEIIESGDLQDRSKQLAKQIFGVIAEAEGNVHGISPEQVHFHEVGAVDSIIDIVGAAICITLLNPDKIICSPLHLGSGTVRCAHGLFPVPAPATADILQGVPVYSTEIKGELVTPTGAAVVKTIADQFAPLPAMVIEKTGYGAGKKQFGMPNLLRVFWGKEQNSTHQLNHEVLLLECNLDDMNPEIYSYVIPLLLEQGALDAYLTQIIMKKGRPGIILSVLCKPGQSQRFEEIIFAETSTLGIRKSLLRRSCLDRKIILIETELGSVNVKVAYRGGTFFKASPEYEDCRKIAVEKSLPLKKVYETVLASDAFEQLQQSKSD